MNSREALEKIREIVGEDVYGKIIHELSGATVYFPASIDSKPERNEQLREDYYSGNYEISDLAKKYDLSISRVYKIIQKRD